MPVQIEIIAEGLGFPEGPIAMLDGSIVLVEIRSGHLTRVTPDGRVHRFAKAGGGPNGAALGPDGKIYVCNNGGFAWDEIPGFGILPIGIAEDYRTGSIQRIDPDTGKVETLYETGPNAPLNGPNDIVFDRTGGFWFTDLGKHRGRLTDNGVVYYAKSDGSQIVEAIYPMVTPNGVGLSPDEKRLYVAESTTGRLFGFDLAGPGEVAPKPFPAPAGGDFLFGPTDYVALDSLAVEAGGNICVGSCFKGGIAVIAPTGGLVEFVPTPDPLTTNICFGGPDLRTAYLTFSSKGLLAKVQWDRPGLPLNFLNRTP